MIKKKIKYILGACAIMVLIISSCVKEEYDMSTMVQTGAWKPEIAMPLVHSIMSVEDLLAPAENDKDDLSEEPDGLMLLVYRDTLFSAWAINHITGFNLGDPPLIGSAVGGPYSVILPTNALDINLEVYNKVVGGSFYFEDPRVNVIVTNSMGVPVDMAMTVLEAWSPVTGSTIPIELWGISIPPATSIPLDNPSSPGYPTVQGDTVVTVYSFTDANSNVKNFLQIGPKYIYYAVQATINPLGDTTSSFFVLDTSEFSVEVEVELPLWGTANFVTMGDTLPFMLDLNDPSGSDLVVTEATFMINTYNRFPADVEMQLLFTDTAGVIIDSLFTNGQSMILQAANIGAAPALRTTGPKHTVNEVLVSRARLDNLGKAREMIVRGRVTTNNLGTQLVKVYSDYTVEVKLGVKAKLQIGE